MRYKKFITITLVTILVCTSITAVAAARFPRAFLFSDEKIIEDKGTISMPRTPSISLLGGRIKIIGEKGTYIPFNLPEEFKVNGIRVKFTAVIIPIFSFLSRFFGGIPIKIITIEKLEPILSFDIHVEREYLLGEPIFVTATLSNEGDEVISVCEMDVRLATLDFFIDTPDGKRLQYVGPLADMLPRYVRILPDESYTSDPIDITARGLFNVIFSEAAPYEFTEGKYSITGFYQSKPTVFEDSLKSVWRGQLYSCPYEFTIMLP